MLSKVKTTQRAHQFTSLQHRRSSIDSASSSTDTMGSASWLRQYEVTLQKNYKLILRRPFHLSILILSSVLSVIFAWLAGRDARGPSGDFPVCFVVLCAYNISCLMFQKYSHLSSNISLYTAIDRLRPSRPILHRQYNQG